MTEKPTIVADDTVRQLTDALYNILERAAGHAEEKGVDEAVFLQWRLAPDMFPMVRQVQIACDITSRGHARLAGVEPLSIPDTEKSISELIQRVEQTKEFIADLDADAIQADPDGLVKIPLRNEEETMRRGDYLHNFVFANAYFHVTMAYAHLRAAGAPLDKADYLALRQSG